VAAAHHFAKGDSTGKSAIDRMSGTGAWARDPDSILVLTPHEEADCYTVSPVLRNLPQVDEFVVRTASMLRVTNTRNRPQCLQGDGNVES
jgi:hypothetical protein